jgi:hypothetical protein
VTTKRIIDQQLIHAVINLLVAGVHPNVAFGAVHNVINALRALPQEGTATPQSIDPQNPSPDERNEPDPQY